MYGWMDVCMYTRMHAKASRSERITMFMHMCLYIYIYIYIYIHIYIRILYCSTQWTDSNIIRAHPYALHSAARLFGQKP